MEHRQLAWNLRFQITHRHHKPDLNLFVCIQYIIKIIRYFLGLKKSKLCSLYNSCDETLIHLFSECQVTIHLWNLLRAKHPHIPFPDLTSQSAFFGFKQELFINQLHIIFRISIIISKAMNNKKRKRKKSTCFCKRPPNYNITLPIIWLADTYMFVLSMFSPCQLSLESPFIPFFV